MGRIISASGVRLEDPPGRNRIRVVIDRLSAGGATDQ